MTSIFLRPALRRRAAQPAIYTLVGLAAIAAFGVATPANAQTPTVESFITSDGVQLYDLTYILPDGSLHLFAGTTDPPPNVTLGLVVFSPTIGDTSLIGHSYTSVFGTGTDLSDIVEPYDGDVDTTDATGSLVTILQSDYAITVPNNGSIAAQGVLFSNGQDIGTIILDPPTPIGVFGLAAESVPESGPIPALAVLGIGALGQAALLRRKRAAKR